MEDKEILAARLVRGLDAAERQILAFVVRGMSNKEIAGVTGSDPEDVRRHRASMMEKLNARTAADAVRIGLVAGLDRPG